MKTTNVILIGVVGVGAVGAYMYMKNKQAQNALLSGSLPATTPSANTPSATAPSKTTQSEAPAPLIPTPNLIETPTPIKDLNLDAYNLQETLDKIKALNARLAKEPNKYFFGQITKEWKSWEYFRNNLYKKQKDILTARLASLGYKFDKGLLIKI